MRTGFCICLLVAAAVVSGGCASAPAEPQAIDDFSYQGTQGPEDLPPDAPCIWVKDERSRETFYGMKVTSEMATNWMSQGIANTLNARTRPTDEVPERGLLISLSKAYVNPIQTTLSAVVVIKVTWGERNSVYRGQIVQTNWWGADKEIGRTMSAALDKALLQINFPMTTSTCNDPAPGEPLEPVEPTEPEEDTEASDDAVA